MKIIKISGFICSVLGLFTTLIGWIEINNYEEIGLFTYAGFISFPLYICCIFLYYKLIDKDNKNLFYYILMPSTIIAINTIVYYFTIKYNEFDVHILIGFYINIFLSILNIIFTISLIAFNKSTSSNNMNLSQTMKLEKTFKILAYVFSLILIFIIYLQINISNGDIKSETVNSQNNQINNQTNFLEIKEGRIVFEGINRIQAVYDGELKNNSSSIYKSVHLSLEIEFELENGNILTQSDFNTENTLFIFNGKFEKNWKPDYNSEVNDLKSHYIPIDIESYPIKKVKAIIKIKAENLIDRVNEEFIIEKNVTSQWNEFIGIPISVNNDNRFDLSKDSYNSQSAIIKDLKIVQNELYIVLDVVSIENTPNEKYDYEIVNTNPKLRIYKIKSNVITINSKCVVSNDTNYLIKNKNSVLNESPFGFVMISTNKFGELTEINLGCWN